VQSGIRNAVRIAQGSEVCGRRLGTPRAYIAQGGWAETGDTTCVHSTWREGRRTPRAYIAHGGRGGQAETGAYSKREGTSEVNYSQTPPHERQVREEALWGGFMGRL
jgi:hypothetical protein